MDIPEISKKTLYLFHIPILTVTFSYYLNIGNLLGFALMVVLAIVISYLLFFFSFVLSILIGLVVRSWGYYIINIFPWTVISLAVAGYLTGKFEISWPLMSFLSKQPLLQLALVSTGIYMFYENENILKKMG